MADGLALVIRLWLSQCWVAVDLDGKRLSNVDRGVAKHVCRRSHDMAAGRKAEESVCGVI